MRPKQRIRKIYTEPDHSDRMYSGDENIPKADKLNIKELELNIKQVGKNISDSKNNRNFMYKNAHFYMPNKFNKLNRKQLIKKLPDINLSPLASISKPMKLNSNDDRENQKMVQNKKNTFLLNSLFEILKPEESNEAFQANKFKEKSLKATAKKNISIDSCYQNQFINVNNSSSKNNRGPKIIQNDITRLSSHNNIMRRRIVSEQKSRPKYHEQSLQKLKQTTFQQFKRCAQMRQGQSNFRRYEIQQPKQNFDNLEIITFYNKFPNVKKEDEDSNTILSRQTEKKNKTTTFKPSTQKIKKTLYKTEDDYENEFIFERK